MSIKKIQNALDKRLISASLTAGETLGTVSSGKKAVASFAALGTTAALSIVPAFADEADEIAQSVAGGLGSVYKFIRLLAIPIAGIGVAFSAMYLITDKDKGWEKTKKAIMYTVGGIFLVLAGPALISKVSGWFDDNQSKSDAIFQNVGTTDAAANNTGG